MAIEAKQLLEDMHKAVHDLREAAELRGRSVDEMRSTLEKANADIDALKKELQREKELRARPELPKEGAPKERSIEYRAIEKYLRYGLSDDSRWTPEEKRALAGTSDADGGYLVPDEFSNDILMNAYDQSELMPYVDLGTTGRDAIVTPSLSKPIVSWGLAGVAVTDQTLSTGQVRIPVHFVQALALVSEDTLADSQANLDAELNGAFGEAVAEAKDDAILVGTGAQQPVGILTLASIQSRAVNSGIAALLTDSTHNGFDVLTQALMSLNKKYRRNATWAMNSATERVLRISKDANGQYLWNPRGSLGEMETLLGRPLATAEGAPDIAANAFPIVVGDFKRYRMRDRSGVTIQRLVERYAEYGQVGFRLKHRTAGAPLLAEAFTPIKIAV